MTGDIRLQPVTASIFSLRPALETIPVFLLSYLPTSVPPQGTNLSSQPCQPLPRQRHLYLAEHAPLCPGTRGRTAGAIPYPPLYTESAVLLRGTSCHTIRDPFSLTNNAPREAGEDCRSNPFPPPWHGTRRIATGCLVPNVRDHITLANCGHGGTGEDCRSNPYPPP